ncbi:cytochrome c oxidase subunit 1 domain protein, partial [Chlamydia psittaci 02DC22]
TSVFRFTAQCLLSHFTFLHPCSLTVDSFQQTTKTSELYTYYSVHELESQAQL